MPPAPFKTTRAVQTGVEKNVRTQTEKVPAKTLSVNLSAYSRRKVTTSGRRIVPLADQYRSMKGEILARRTVQDFIRDHLYKGEEPRKTCFLHPSFDKPPEDQGMKIENVVMRVNSAAESERDLVIQGDFEQNERTGGWELMATRVFLAEHAGKYIGETEAECNFFLTVNDGSDLYYDTAGKELKSRKGINYSNSIITPEFVRALAGRYPVLDPKATEDNLDDWARFLDMRDEISGLNSGKGYRIRTPEFIQACYGPISDVPADIIIVDDGTTAWTDEIIPGMPQCTLVKVVHDIEGALTNSEMRAYLDGFNGLTRGTVKAVDPLIEKEEYEADPDERRRNRELSMLGERIKEAQPNRPLSKEETAEIDRERDSALDSLDKECAGILAERMAAAEAEFASSPEAESEVAAYAASSKDIIEKLAEKIRSEKADSQYLAAQESGTDDRDWEQFYDLIPAEECLSEAVKKSSDERMAQIAGEHAGSMRPAIESELAEHRKKRSAEIESEYRRKAAELSKKLSRNSLTVFFRIQPEEGMSVLQDVKDRTAHLGSRSELVIVEDDAAERSAVDRQRTAISELRTGTMANPYLISSIYCPELIPPHKEASVSHTFGRHFNELQMRAINGAVFANGFYMIQGPPGTGKTQVIAEIAAQEVIRGHKVLIASQGNKAVDNAFERLRPYSFIRPVRIMAEKKESEYELKNIVSTFYGGICKAVEDRMDLFGDPERRAEIDGKISEFRAFYKDSYAPKKAEAEPTIRKVRALRKDLNDRLYKISCDNAALESSRRRYEAMCGRLGRLGDFERDDYRDYASKILSLFEGIGAHDRDSVVFGPDGLCSAIASISEDDLYDTIERYEGFRDAGTLPNDALSLMFAEGMPNSIPKIKNALEEIQEIVRREAEAERDEAEKASRYDPKDEDEARSLYGAKMDTYASNPAYAEYLEAERHLHGIVSELFSLMKVTDRYETMDEARRIVDKEAKVLDAFSGMNLRETMAACRDIDGYLRTESVAGIDSDQLIDELSSCVNVVGMTCTAREIASRSNAREFPEIDLRKMGIDVAIIDEVSKVPFPELIRPMSYAKKVILVGDHKQLPPVYNERAEDDTMEELNAKYARMYSEPLFMSMFDRASEDSKTMLKTQYRMTSQIMGVINRFYGGALEMPEGIPERSHRMRIDGRTRPLITPEHSVLFIDCKGKERREGGSTSFVNDAEADAVAKLVKLLDSRCRCDSFGNPLGSERSVPMSMGVITPYADQIRSIKRILRMDGRNGFRLRSFRNDGEERFMVKSVDDFQGDERDVIIVSLVRTTKSKFISDFRRINVAMSRARRLLIIVGDADSLGKVSVDLDGNGRYSNAYQDIISDLKLADCFADASEIPEAAE